MAVSGAKIMELAQGLGLSIDDLRCDETDEHDMVNVEESPGVYVHRKRQWGECFCHAYDDSECACGGLWEQRETERQAAEARAAFSNLASNLAVAAFGCLAFYYGSILDGSRERWRPGCGHPAPGFDDGRK